MKISRKELRKLIAEAVDSKTETEQPEDPVWFQVRTSKAYYDLEDALQKNYGFDLWDVSGSTVINFKRMLKKAVIERNIDGMKRMLGPSGYGLPTLPTWKKGEPEYYKPTDGSIRYSIKQINDATYTYLGIKLGLSDSGINAFKLNACIEAFNVALKEAARLVQDAIDNPTKYNPPERNFFQKAGSFLTGKGFRE